jgi:DeoR/GlpR family transcriptional regulator of sugar metabolism
VNEALAARRTHLVPVERRRQILAWLHQRGSVAVSELEAGFGISQMTARRDLAMLAEEGRVRRTHGGAVLPELAGHEDSFDSRVGLEVADKIRIAKAVVATLAPNETVFVDSSSSAHYVLREILDARIPVTVVTNSVPAITAVLAADAPNVEVIGLGGEVRKLTRSFVGAETVGAIRDVFVDRLVFSVKGIERGGFLTDPDALEADVKRAMIDRARTVVLLATSTKFDERGLHVIAHASRIQVAYLADPPRDGVQALADAQVDVRIV